MVSWRYFRYKESLSQKAKMFVLSSYVNDSICGTWEQLADSVYKGGSQRSFKSGVASVIGAEKSAWAEKYHAAHGFGQ